MSGFVRISNRKSAKKKENITVAKMRAGHRIDQNQAYFAVRLHLLLPVPINTEKNISRISADLNFSAP